MKPTIIDSCFPEDISLYLINQTSKKSLTIVPIWCEHYSLIYGSYLKEIATTIMDNQVTTTTTVA
jgi:hypothetical protein